MSNIINNIYHPWKTLKRFFPQSLFGRAIIILLTPLILVQLVLGYIFFDRHTETILRTLSHSIAGEVSLIVNYMENDTQRIHDIQKFVDTHLQVDTHFSEGKKLSTVGMKKNRWLYRILSSALDERLKYPYYLHMNSDTIFIDIQTSQGVIHVSTLRKRLFSRTTPLVLIWTCLSALLLFAVAMIFMRNQIRPLQRLSDAAERFGKGDMDVPLQSVGASEIRATTNAFKSMRGRIKRLIEERTLMLAGVSHDLRTVLTRMKLSLHVAPSLETQTNLKEDVSTMQNMVEGFLNYAKDMQDEKSQTFDISQMCSDILERIPRNKTHLTFSGEKFVFVTAKKTLINRCLTNLMLNSIRHASHTWVHIRVVDTQVQVCIDDNGPGILPQLREEVFKPFYRLDTSRNLNESGSGLGLTIAKQVIVSHGGEISLEESPQGGLRVRVVLLKTNN